MNRKELLEQKKKANQPQKKFDDGKLKSKLNPSKLREPLLGVVVGKKGVGKTHTTLNTQIANYVAHPTQPRRVLLFDVNNEFGQFKAISLRNVKAWSDRGRIEVRRISIYKAYEDMSLLVNGKPVYNTAAGKMTLNEMANALYYILNSYHDGLLLIEDINKYVSDSLPNDLMGAIVTQRHIGVDIIIHFQTIGKFGHPKIVGNANYLRFHKVSDKVARHETKFQDYTEPLQIMEKIVDKRFKDAVTKDDKSFHCYWDADDLKIKGAFSKDEFVEAVNEYLSENYNSIVKPKVNQVDLKTGEKKYKSREKLIDTLINQYIYDYYGN